MEATETGVRDARVRRVLLVTLGLNCLVAGAKILYGYYIASVGITADGFHSLFDGVSNVVGLAGLWLASRPADEDHPYGHKKYETLATIAISVMMILTSLEILKRAFASLAGGRGPHVSAEAFILMSATLSVNVFVAWYESREGEALASDFLLADASHTRSDIYTTLSVIAGLAGVSLGFPILDPLVALAITVLIARMGFGILKSASDILVDRVMIDSDRICEIAEGVAGVRGCHNIRTRGRADAVYVDLHVFVDREIRTDVAHGIVHEVIDRIKEALPEVADVVVHVEPFNPGQRSG